MSQTFVLQQVCNLNVSVHVFDLGGPSNAVTGGLLDAALNRSVYMRPGEAGHMVLPIRLGWSPEHVAGLSIEASARGPRPAPKTQRQLP